MEQRFCVLNDDYSLASWEGMPYAIVSKSRAEAAPVSEAEMNVLWFCDGTIDLNLPVIPESVREIADLAERNGVIRRVSGGETRDLEESYTAYPNKYIEAAHWSVTGKCNYRCRHCYMSAPDAVLGELSHEEIMDIARQIADCGIRKVSLTGGEPLIRKDFLQIVEALLERGIRITTIYSNGRLVTDELLQALSGMGIHPEFNMSFDGTEGWHDWLRGIPGAEREVRSAFERCAVYGFSTAAEMCLHRQNAHTLRSSINALASWDCSSLKTNPISVSGAWRESGRRESISMDALLQTYLDYVPRYYEDGMPLSLMLGGFFHASPVEPDAFGIPILKPPRDPEELCVCGHARMTLYISPEGRTLPCMPLSGMKIQQQFPLIGETGLRECLQDSFYMQLIEMPVSEYLKQNPECGSCRHARICAGGCRAGGLEREPDNLVAPDRAACRICRDGWIPKILAAVYRARPDAALQAEIPDDLWQEYLAAAEALLAEKPVA